MEKINIKEKLALFSEHWIPKIVAELNDQYVKLVKIKGEFVWHKHYNEDEMFYVIDGMLKIEFRIKTVELNKNEFIIIPRGVEHRPVADEEVSVMLFESSNTLNTGDTKSDFTIEKLERI